jgi:hypothetical protein
LPEVIGLLEEKISGHQLELVNCPFTEDGLASSSVVFLERSFVRQNIAWAIVAIDSRMKAAGYVWNLQKMQIADRLFPVLFMC